MSKKVTNRYDKNYRGGTSGYDGDWKGFFCIILQSFGTMLLPAMGSVACAIENNFPGAIILMITFAHSLNRSNKSFGSTEAKEIFKSLGYILFSFLVLLFTSNS